MSLSVEAKTSLNNTEEFSVISFGACVNKEIEAKQGSYLILWSPGFALGD